MPKTIGQAPASLTQLLRRASEALMPTRRHLAVELAHGADLIEKLRAEARVQCEDEHRMGCSCELLRMIDEGVDRG